MQFSQQGSKSWSDLHSHILSSQKRHFRGDKFLVEAQRAKKGETTMSIVWHVVDSQIYGQMVPKPL
jgi:hypothetical protein